MKGAVYLVCRLSDCRNVYYNGMMALFYLIKDIAQPIVETLDTELGNFQMAFASG